MARRLVEQYQPGDQVEISFGDDDWRPGRVVKSEHPGLWIVTENGRPWFVTNRRRIRKATQPRPGSTS